jgi:hypothetical protein
MTVLSAAIGFALPAFLPRRRVCPRPRMCARACDAAALGGCSYTHYASAFLFLYFGAKLVREGLALSAQCVRVPLRCV